MLFSFSLLYESIPCVRSPAYPQLVQVQVDSKFTGWVLKPFRSLDEDPRCLR